MRKAIQPLSGILGRSIYQCDAIPAALVIASPHQLRFSSLVEQPKQPANIASSVQDSGQSGSPPTSVNSQQPSRETRRRGPKSRTVPTTLTRLWRDESVSDCRKALAGTDQAVMENHSMQSLYFPRGVGKADLMHLLRRHNHSMPGLKGQVVQARILHLTPDRVYVDAGFHSISEMYRPGLNVTHVVTPVSSAPLNRRLGTSDLRIGDVLRVRIDTLYTPFGDMQLEPVQDDPSLQMRARWSTLVDHFNNNKPVSGRVLNQVRGGYAVGIAGFVGLLPYHRASSIISQRIGMLENFYIKRIVDERQLLILVDVRMAPKGPRKAQITQQ